MINYIYIKKYANMSFRYIDICRSLIVFASYAFIRDMIIGVRSIIKVSREWRKYATAILSLYRF